MSPELRKSRNHKRDPENTVKKGEKQEEQLRKQMTEFVLMKDKEEKKKQKTEMSQNLSAYQQKLEYNNRMIQELEPSKKAIKEDLKHLRKMHRKFLLKLLKSGKDFRFLLVFLLNWKLFLINIRKTGLVWLIKKCWSLGENITEQNLPDYMDSKAKDFLLMVTFIWNVSSLFIST